MDQFAVLGDPHRRGILELLGGGERAAGDIGRHLPISAPAVSQHLKVLREASLVRVRSEGQRRIYSLDPSGFSKIEAWFEKMRGFWSVRLDRLEQELRKKGMK